MSQKNLKSFRRLTRERLDLEIAHHEAGHAVVDLWNGIEVTTVVLCNESDPDYRGLSTAEVCPLQEITGEGLPGILAGPLAAIHFNGDEPTLGVIASRPENSVDLAMAYDCARKMYKESRRPKMVLQLPEVRWVEAVIPPDDGEEIEVQRLLERHVEYTTTQFVVANWNGIQAVAKALFKKRRLSGREVLQLI
jgi:hypothetical protein